VTKDILPTYAIVELLMRLGQINPHVGDYKDHTVYTTGVMVKTTNGSITFAKDLIKQQFNDPELIAEAELKNVLQAFKPAK